MPQPPMRPRARTPEPRDRTPERVLAVAGVVAMLIVLVVAITLIAGAGGDGDEETQAAAEPTPTQTAEPSPTPKPKPTPKPLTAGEKAERQEAADLVESRGFDPVRLKDYNPKATLRVMIGKSTTGSQLAFFFVEDDYIGNDSSDTSVRIKVAKSTDLVTTLRYATYAPGDDQEKPTGEPITVRFRWDGVRLEPVEALPAPEQRTPGRQLG